MSTINIFRKTSINIDVFQIDAHKKDKISYTNMNIKFILWIVFVVVLGIWGDSYFRLNRVILDDTYIFASPYFSKYLDSSLRRNDEIKTLLSQYIGIDNEHPLEQSRDSLRCLHKQRNILVLFQDYVRTEFNEYEHVKFVDILFQNMDTDVTLQNNTIRSEISKLFFDITNINLKDLQDPIPYINILRNYDDYFHSISIQFRSTGDEKWEYSHFVAKFIIFDRALYQKFVDKA